MVKLESNGASINVEFLYVVFPSGLEGWRIDSGQEDFGTIYYNPKKKKWMIVNW